MKNEENENKALNKTDVSSSFGNIKFTSNTKEVRDYLEQNGFVGLSFFQGKEYIYAFLTTRANKNGEWKEKDYSTFSANDKETMKFLEENVSDFKNFKTYIEQLILNYC